MDTIRLIVLSGYCTTECIIVERGVRLLTMRENLEQSACGLLRNILDRRKSRIILMTLASTPWEIWTG